MDVPQTWLTYKARQEGTACRPLLPRLLLELGPGRLGTHALC